MTTDLYRIAVIADIHSNLAALEAVLADIAGQNCDTTVNLGDIVSGPLHPRETAERLMPLGFPTVRGNHERQLLTLAVPDLGLSDTFAMDVLTGEHLAWIQAMPERLVLSQGVLLVHGTPSNDLAYLLETVEPEGCRAATPAEVEDRLSGVDAAVVLCGHTHLAREMRLADGRLVVNPGSVGLPAYQEAHPYMHRNEAGSPDARYAIVEKRSDRWHSEFRSVAYDWEGQAMLAEQRQRVDWACALRTGHV